MCARAYHQVCMTCVLEFLDTWSSITAGAVSCPLVMQPAGGGARSGQELPPSLRSGRLPSRTSTETFLSRRVPPQRTTSLPLFALPPPPSPTPCRCCLPHPRAGALTPSLWTTVAVVVGAPSSSLHLSPPQIEIEYVCGVVGRHDAARGVRGQYGGVVEDVNNRLRRLTGEAVS